MLRILAIVVLMLLTMSLYAQSTQPAEAPVTVLRTYNISDLVRATQDYPLPDTAVPMPYPVPTGPGGGGFVPSPGGMGGAPFGPAKVLRAPVADVGSIVQLIQETINPQSWVENGGAEGKISTLGTLLIINQTAQGHNAIQELLSQLRQDLGPASMVCVRAYWISLQPDEAQKLMGKGQPAPQQTPEVPDELLDASKIYCQLQTMCFSGQTVHISSGREQTVIGDVEAVVGTEAVAVSPKPTIVLAGVQMQVRPQIVPDTQAAVIDVSSTVAETNSITASPVRSPTTQSTTTEIDRRNGIRQNLQTTVRLPMGKKILIGGMTLEPASQSGRQIYLVLEVSALEAR